MKWKEIKVGDKLKDGSVVTQVHRTHEEECCRLIYDNDQEMICALRHVFLIDVHNLPKEGLKELNETCTFVPIEEDFSVTSEKELSAYEKVIVQQFLCNEKIDVAVDCIKDDEEQEIYDFHFADGVKRVFVENIITKSEPQKVDETTFWLSCGGIMYLMHKYNVDLYCNGLIINSIESVGKLPCFCISTDTGRYET